MSKSFSDEIKQKPKTDEWYTPRKAVKIIVPFLKKANKKKILCPFDKEESQFVQVFKENGFDVTYSHIEDGRDFFAIENLQDYDAIVSNPPYSKRQEVLEKLFHKKVPFAMILNFNGLFDSRRRWELFKNNRVELLVPSSRIHFFNNKCNGSAPNFQSVYVCSGILQKQIEFAEMEKFSENDLQIPGQLKMEF